MRIALAEIAQETDSFSPIVAERSDFEANGLYFGQDILREMQGVGPLGGFLEIAAQEAPGASLLPLVRAWGGAGGTWTRETLDYFTAQLVAGLQAALPLDAVFLSLHGAAAAEQDDDVEGHVLATVRAIVGPSIPVVVAVDHHANITRRMIEHATLLIGHETQPHDPPATGRKSARLLFRQLAGEVRPSVAWRKIPMITPQDQFLTSDGPMREWFELAREYERRPGVLDVSPYPMQPWLDVAEGGWAVVVHTNDDRDLAEQIAAEMADQAWSRRARFWASERVAPAEAVRQAVAAEQGLIILSDTGDSVYGGAPGDNTTLLTALVEANVPCLSLAPVVDPAAVEAALAAGAGATITLEVGGKTDRQFCRPLRVTGTVLAVSRDYTADLADRGPSALGATALLGVGQVRIVLLSHRSFAINHPILYEHLGIDVGQAKLVVVKTASNFQFFAPWRRGLIRVDTPGTTQSNLTAFDWQRVPRPLYPLDKLEHWQAPRA